MTKELTLRELEAKYPEFKDFVNAAKEQGYTKEEVIKYI
jgi:hypothetical protein